MYLDSCVHIQCAPHVLHVRDFCLHVNQQKTRAPGSAHAKHIFLPTGTVHAGIKFKLSFTVHQIVRQVGRLCGRGQSLPKQNDVMCSILQLLV